MNELSLYEKQLPDNIEDLSKFVLIGTEKLVAMKAEIRAICKCNLAKEVYDQKMDEQRMLAELILDASVKIGELTKTLPKATRGTGNNQYAKKENAENDSGVGFSKSKTERIQELGFSPKQVERFETLADNKDVVEQVKAEARENDDIPTRSRVIDIVQQRKRDDPHKREMEAYKAYQKAINSIQNLGVTYPIDIIINSIIDTPIPLSDEIEDIDKATAKLYQIKQRLIMKGGHYGT